MTSIPPTLGMRTRSAAPSRRPSAWGVLGEVLITFGVIVLLYVAWQMWIGDAIISTQRQAEAREVTEQWASAPVDPVPDAAEPAAEPIVAEPVGEGEVFATLHIPRFGDDWIFPIAEGVSKTQVLDPIGVGHYPGTPMPGAMGNVALAAHRYTHGAPFENVPSLQVGDAIVLETADGWYTYRYRNMEYVRPDEVSVLAPVPQNPGAAADGRYLTLTTCSPMWSTQERIAAYAVFESFTPRAAGEPDALTSAEGA
ncbi:class E sortase [Microbacterium sp. zg.Y1090]|uniref:class E sortase n=1 Tax=Microbacterium TaxID=33882 RepID=UPI00214CBD78|nr:MULTISPECIES: class E sortase [unclassified Microbacterium]MCR2813019.1 class E sortase [Microbacterium sp. zg.Y1084]MCR2819352.1 class E sortase [Microbacterium sp. zg.Y1090]MDL5487269.1 class E sortase [Microbacterium sp. zg-Y1211]WIM28333.1 class E sortase [Microbacterium sp. zg-Y1090]